MKNRKRIEIIQDENTNRNIFFMYGENGSICGLNFHHGIDATDAIGGFDQNYAKNDEHLFDIYLEICKAEAPTRFEFIDKVEVANRAIDEWWLKNDPMLRSNIIEELVEQQFEILYEKVIHKMSLSTCDMSVDQRINLDRIKNKVAKALSTIVTQNLN